MVLAAPRPLRWAWAPGDSAVSGGKDPVRKCSTRTAWFLLLPLLAAAQVVFFVELRARCTWSLAGRSYVFLFEDAMVSMRYAYQLAHGHGLVWNLGERVQGFTNLGWTLLMAVGHLVDKSHETAAWFVLFANFILHGALIVMVFALARPLGVVLALIAAAVVATHSALLFWGTMGMETTLVALLVTAAFSPWLPIPGKRLGTAAAHAPWLAALAFVVRSDGILFFGLAAALAWRERLHLKGDRGDAAFWLAAHWDWFWWLGCCFSRRRTTVICCPTPIARRCLGAPQVCGPV